MVRKTTFIVAALILAVALGGGADAAKPKLTETDDAFVLENDHVRVMLHNRSTQLILSPAGAAAGGFAYEILGLVEYRDLDADGAPSAAETLASLDLVNATAWEATSKASDEDIVLNLTLNAPVKIGRGALAPPSGTPAERMASVSIVFTLRGAAGTFNASGVDVTIPATSIKYDLLVHKWPFANGELGRLALDTRVLGEVELENATGLEGAQVVSNGTTLGAVGWTTLAMGRNAAGEALDVPVHAAVAREAPGMTRITYTYDASGYEALVHDPHVGIAPTPGSLLGDVETPEGLDVPGLGSIVGALAVGSAAIALRRR